MSTYRQLTREEAQTLWLCGSRNFEYMIPSEGMWREWGDWPDCGPYANTSAFRYRIAVEQEDESA